MASSSPYVTVDDETVVVSPVTTPPTCTAAADVAAPPTDSGSGGDAASPPSSAGKHKPKGVGTINVEQQNALERSLKQRPSEGSLQAAGIVKPGGRFAAEKSRLARQLASHAVARELSDRPAASELSASGILEQAHVAPSLAGVAKSLNKQLVSHSLNKQLAARQAAGGVEQVEHMMRASEVAPRLRSAKVALEHALTRDRVGQQLEARPDMAQLLHQGILASPVSARLAGPQRMLQRNFTANLVGHLLEGRQGVEELKKEGVMRDMSVAPRLQGVQRTLERNLAKSNLFHALQSRPTVNELAERGIWRPNPELHYYEELDEYEREDLIAQREREDQEAAEQAYYYSTLAAQTDEDYMQSPMSPSSAANRAANMSYAQNPLQSPNTTARYAGVAAAEAAYRHYQQQAAVREAEDRAYRQQRQQQQQQRYPYDSPLSPSPSQEYYNQQVAQWQQAQQAWQAQQAQQQQAAQQAYANDGHLQQVRDEYGEWQMAEVAAMIADDERRKRLRQHQQQGHELTPTQRRSRNFHLTRVLLQTAASMGPTGELDAAARSFLKELIVDQVPEIFALAERFDRDGNMEQFRGALQYYAYRR